MAEEVGKTTVVSASSGPAQAAVTVTRRGLHFVDVSGGDISEV
jgi:hypothetical protein